MSLANKVIRNAKNFVNESFLFNPIANFLEEEQAEKSENYSWEATNYKFYPSSITSIFMCPKRFVEETVHTPSYFQLSALESMEIGQEYHRAYQNVAMRIPGFCLEPDYTYFESLFGKIEADKLRVKTKAAWPEVSFYCPVSGFSGRMDLVLAKSPRIVDIKSIGQLDVVKDKKTGSVKFGQWDALLPKLPKEEHKIQDSLYIYFSNKYKLFSQPIDLGGIAYINTRLDNASNKHEAGFGYTNQINGMIDHLVSRLAIHRTAWMNKLCVECEYQYCPDHSKTAL